jgi:hypothetical protein
MSRTGKSVYLVTACTAKQHAYESEKDGGHCTKSFMTLTIQHKITFQDIERHLIASVVQQTTGLQTPEIHLFGQARPYDKVRDILGSVKRALIVAPVSDLPGVTVDVQQLMQWVPMVTHDNCKLTVLYKNGENLLPKSKIKPLAATPERIRYYIERLMRSKESVALFICSHGRSGEEGEGIVLDPDGLQDETKCLMDINIKNMVLRFLMSPATDRVVNAFIMLDICFSGGLSVRDDCDNFERQLLKAPQAWELQSDGRYMPVWTNAFSSDEEFLEQNSEDWEADRIIWQRRLDSFGSMRPDIAPPPRYDELESFSEERLPPYVPNARGGDGGSPVSATNRLYPVVDYLPTAPSQELIGKAVPDVQRVVTAVATASSSVPDVAPGAPTAEAGAEEGVQPAQDFSLKGLMELLSTVLWALSLVAGILKQHSQKIWTWVVALSPSLMRAFDWCLKRDWTSIKSIVEGALLISKGYLIMIMCSFICAFFMLMRRFSEYQHKVLMISILNTASFFLIRHLADPLMACENFDLNDKRVLGASLFAVSVGALFWVGVSTRQLTKKDRLKGASPTVPGLLQIFFLSVHMVGLPMLPHEIKLKSGAVLLYQPLNGTNTCELRFKNAVVFNASAETGHSLIEDRVYAAGCNYSVFLSVLNNWTGKDASQVSEVILQGERLDFGDSFQKKYVHRMLEFNRTLDEFADEVENAQFTGSVFQLSDPEHNLDVPAASSFWGSVERHAGHYYDVIEFFESMFRIY